MTYILYLRNHQTTLWRFVSGTITPLRDAFYVNNIFRCIKVSPQLVFWIHRAWRAMHCMDNLNFLTTFEPPFSKLKVHIVLQRCSSFCSSCPNYFFQWCLFPDRPSKQSVLMVYSVGSKTTEPIDISNRLSAISCLVTYRNYKIYHHQTEFYQLKSKVKVTLNVAVPWFRVILATTSIGLI